MTEQDFYDRYIKNVAAYCAKVNLDGKRPDERYMRSVEDALGMPDHMCHAYRQNLLRRYAADMILHGSHDWRWDEEFVKIFQQMAGGG